MADSVTSQTIVDGDRNVVMKFTNISDGTGEAAVKKVDVTTLSGYGKTWTELRIEKIIATTFGMGVQILWDATTDVLAFYIPADQYLEQDFSKFGGLPNNAGTGKNGSINFTTVGHSAGDVYTIVLEMKKGS